MRFNTRTNELIQFSRGAFRFVGRTNPGTDIRPDVGSLAFAIGALASGLSRMPQSVYAPGVQPAYIQSVKILMSLGVNPMWRVRHLVEALSILHEYFRLHPSSQSLDMTISSVVNQRASLRIAKVPAQHFEADFSRGEVPPKTDFLNIWFYTEDVIDQQSAIEAVGQIVSWFHEHNPPEPIDLGTQKIFRADGLEFLVSVPETQAVRTTDVTFEELMNAFHVILHVKEEHVQDRWTIFQGTVTESNGRIRAHFELRKEYVGRSS